MGENAGDEGGGDGGLSKRERRMLGNIAEYLGFADFLALMMVTATAFTGYATWRTAAIARSIFLSSERPYIGVKSVEIDASHPGDPRVEIRYENFGHVSAESARVVRSLMIDGKRVASETKTRNAGILSPEVTHRLHLHIPSASYAAIINGHATLKVELAAAYTGPGRGPLCYLERFVYLADEKEFEVDGGSTRCDDQKELEMAGAADDY